MKDKPEVLLTVMLYFITVFIASIVIFIALCKEYKKSGTCIKFSYWICDSIEQMVIGSVLWPITLVGYVIISIFKAIKNKFGIKS